MTQLFLQAPRGKELESDLLKGSNLGLRQDKRQIFAIDKYSKN
jgi:hypothetical protein